MDYIITMTDGSKYLAHHGVEGMHWGEWNEETRRKYLGITSAKGDKLRKKATSKRFEAEKARTDKAVLNRASQVHANDITKAYAKANAHRIKQQASERRASDIRRKADAERRAGNDKKADKLERKSEKQTQKAKREEDAAKRESDKGHAASKRIERHNIAVREMDAKAAKLNAKAAKLEKKADKADAKQDKRAEKASEKVRDAAVSLRENHGDYLDLKDRHMRNVQRSNELEDNPKATKKQKDEAFQAYNKTLGKVLLEGDRPEVKEAYANLRKSTENYLVESGSKNATKFLGTIRVKNEKAFRREVTKVMDSALSEAKVISKEGRDSVDVKIEQALGTKRGYRYL